MSRSQIHSQRFKKINSSEENESWTHIVEVSSPWKSWIHHFSRKRSLNEQSSSRVFVSYSYWRVYLPVIFAIFYQIWSLSVFMTSMTCEQMIILSYWRYVRIANQRCNVCNGNIYLYISVENILVRELSPKVFSKSEICEMTMDLAYMCVKPQMRLYVCHQMRLNVCHQMRLLNPQHNGVCFARLLLLASLGRFSTVQTGILVQWVFLCKHWFLSKYWLLDPKWTQMDPKWTQNGPKMDPKWTHNGPIMDPKWTQNGPKMDPKWTHNGPMMDPKWTQNGPKNGPKMDPKWTQTVTHMWTHLELDSPRNEEFTQFCDFHHWNSALCALFSHICAYKHIHQRIMLKCWYQKFDVQFQWFSRNPSLNVQYNNDSKQRYWSGGTNPTIVSYMTIVQSDIMEKIPQVWFSENWTPCSRNQRDLEVWSPAIYVVLNTSDHDSCTEAKLETHMKKNENKVE